VLAHRDVEGPPIRAFGWTVVPVARACQVVLHRGGWAITAARGTPWSVRVRDAHGAERVRPLSTAATVARAGTRLRVRGRTNDPHRTEAPMTDTDGGAPAMPIEELGERASAALGPFATISASDVFSAPVEVGERVVVTAATIIRGGGFGFGGGTGAASEGAPAGSGGGGGGRSVGRPTAVIEISPAGVDVRPVPDVTRLVAMAFATVVALLLLRRRRARRQP
jgi:uncharacterized spore protein YtfJ